MKTLTTFAAAVLMILSLGAFANDDLAAEKLKMNYAVNAYIDAFVHGKIKGIQDVVDSNTKFTYTLGNRIKNYNKDEIFGQLKNNINVEQDCATNYEVVELNLSQAVVKVNMKYTNFTKVDLINLARTNKGWKITNVSSSFINK